MQIRIFTLRFSPVTESFADSAVAGFLADKEALSIRDHFFTKDDVPYLTLVIRYRTAALPAAAETAKSKQKPNDAWREQLDDAIEKANFVQVQKHQVAQEQWEPRWPVQRRSKALVVGA